MTKEKEDKTMHELVHNYTKPSHHREQSYGRLVEEIAYLEARLIAIGHTGDCAYEKSLARTYSELLRTRRRELALLKD
jgi:hypothetical protein